MKPALPSLLVAALASGCAHAPPRTVEPAAPPSPFPLALPTCTPEPPVAHSPQLSHFAVGENVPCALRPDGRLACWGTFDNAGQPVPTPDDQFVELAGGATFLCGQHRDGSVRCWGDDNDGMTRPHPGTFRHIAAAGSSLLAVDSDGAVQCFGDCWTKPPPPPKGRRYVDAAYGPPLGCALDDAGAITCWGGNDARASTATPPAGHYRAVAIGLEGACGLRDDGTLGCGKASQPPSTVASAGPFVALSGRGADLCALSREGVARCWRSGHSMNVPDARFSEVYGVAGGGCGIVDGTPRCWGLDRPFLPYQDARRVAVGEHHRCTLGRDCVVRCTGEGDLDEETAAASGPMTVADLRAADRAVDESEGRVAAIAVGEVVCRLRAKGGVACGDRVAPGTDREPFVAIAVDGVVGCALSQAGAIVCWGGESNEPSLTVEATDGAQALGPAPPGRYVDLALGGGHACAVRDDGAITCWGAGAPAVSAAPATSGARFTHVATGKDYTCALGERGAATCWGRGPAAPPGVFRAIAVGERHACALDAGDGHAVCWGDDEVTKGWPATPRGPFRSITATGRDRCGVRPNGDVTCWGATRLDE